MATLKDCIEQIQTRLSSEQDYPVIIFNREAVLGRYISIELQDQEFTQSVDGQDSNIINAGIAVIISSKENALDAIEQIETVLNSLQDFIPQSAENFVRESISPLQINLDGENQISSVAINFILTWKL